MQALSKLTRSGSSSNRCHESLAVDKSCCLLLTVDRLATATRAAVDAWGLQLLCKNPRWRSDSLTVIETPASIHSDDIVKCAPLTTVTGMRAAVLSTTCILPECH